MSGRGAFLVGAGIFLSRIAGLVRQKALAFFLGLSDESDAFAAAFRIPNLLQNLLGEGALSASFIPAYARLVGEEREAEARHLAGAVLALLATVVSVVVLIGVLAAPLLTDLLVGRWTGEKRDLTITLVRILFPGAGVMVLSAWCLGVLNSHGKFFLSYAAPVAWNLIIILTLVIGGPVLDRPDLVTMTAWASVAGSLVMVVVQWPAVRAVGGQIILRSWRGVAGVPDVVRRFFPTMISRGALQISSFIDLTIAGFLPSGAVMAIANAQVLHTLPVSLFGMAVSAAELPEMARERGDVEAVARAIRVRLDAATQRVAYYVVPSAVAFLAVGGVLASAIYQGGAFTAADSQYVWLILAAGALGLLASTVGRLHASAFYALGDTMTPLKCGLVRVGLTAGLGVVAALKVPGWVGLPASYGAAGLAFAAAVASHAELLLLRQGLCRRIGRFDLPFVEVGKLWLAAFVAAVPASLLRLAGAEWHPILLAAAVVPVFGVTYLALTYRGSIPEAAVIVGRLRRVARQ